MQARDEGAAVDLLAAARAVAEPDDVGAALAETGLEGQPLRVVDQRDEPASVSDAVATNPLFPERRQ